MTAVSIVSALVFDVCCIAVIVDGLAGLVRMMLRG